MFIPLIKFYYSYYVHLHSDVTIDYRCILLGARNARGYRFVLI